MKRPLSFFQLCILCFFASITSLQAQQLPMGLSPQQISTHVMDPIEFAGYYKY